MVARWRPVIASCSAAPFDPYMCLNVDTQCSCTTTMTFISHTYLAHKGSGGNEVYQQRRHYKVLGFQLLAATAGSSFLSDAAGRPGSTHRACPCLCQIKGQRLDGEATLLFIPVQPRERPNKSRGNVVTRESERSLPTGRGKWRNSLSLNLPGYVLFSFFLFLNVTFSLRPPLIRSLIILCLPCRGF